MKTLKKIEAWLDGWGEHPSHIVTVAIIVILLGGLAIGFAIIAS